jgi:aspartate-semialdehyde dehydrogenase
MVGSVLLQRMLDENDFKDISAHLDSTSNVGLRHLSSMA